jgi:hypothetical protein
LCGDTVDAATAWGVDFPERRPEVVKSDHDWADWANQATLPSPICTNPSQEV